MHKLKFMHLVQNVTRSHQLNFYSNLQTVDFFLKITILFNTSIFQRYVDGWSNVIFAGNDYRLTFYIPTDVLYS